MMKATGFIVGMLVAVVCFAWIFYGLAHWHTARWKPPQNRRPGRSAWTDD